MIKRCKFCKIVIEGRANKKYCGKSCQSKNLYKKNPQKFIDRAKNWHDNNIERDNANKRKYNKKYYQKNKEKMNKLMLKQYYKNKEKWKIRAITAYHKSKIIKEQNYKCDKCGIKTDKLLIKIKDWDWIKNNKGKNDYIVNRKKVECLCKKCHLNGKKE